MQGILGRMGKILLLTAVVFRGGGDYPESYLYLSDYLL